MMNFGVYMYCDILKVMQQEEPYEWRGGKSVYDENQFTGLVAQERIELPSQLEALALPRGYSLMPIEVVLIYLCCWH
jgi:hypothetical protein